MKKIALISSVIAITALVSTPIASAAYGYGSSGSRSSYYVAPSGTTPSTTPAGRVLGASTYSFSTFLSRNSSSDAVVQLQERLRAEGFFTFPTSTGFFGPITFAAVQAYQRAHGIRATGFVGPLTLAALNG